MKQYTMDQRHALISEWEKSGKTINQFCRDNELKATTFHGWRQRYSRKPQSLIELPVKKPVFSSKTSSIELQWKSYRIKLDRDFDPVGLKKVLQVLEQLDD